MGDDWDHDFAEDELDRRIRAQRAPAPSGDLVDRCLGTIGPPASVDVRPKWRQLMLRHRRKITVSVFSAVAAVLVACLVLFSEPNGAGNLFAAAHRALDTARAYHFKRIDHVNRMEVGPDGKFPGVRTYEGWVVRGVGRRVEGREGGKTIEVTVDDSRWVFHWDVARKHVIAGPSELADPSAETVTDRLLLPLKKFLKEAEWEVGGEKSRLVRQKDRLDGKDVEKVTMTLEGPRDQRGTVTAWFESDTQRPIRYQYQVRGFWEFEMEIDYPAAQSVPAERFRFEMPREALLEINDPRLGRQIYSEGQTGPDLRP